MAKRTAKSATSLLLQDTDESADRLRTPRDLLRFAVSQFNEAGLFFGHGSHDAYDEAVYLILHVLHLPLDRIEPFLDAQLLDHERTAVMEILRRRIDQRKPAAYLTNEAWLGDLRFYVDERVIVPRSFIAELLREKLQPWISNASRIRHALDLCTGSGCLAVLMAHAFPDAHIDATDVHDDALEVARRNIADYRLTRRIELIRSDLFKALQGRKYDLIVSNPPYVDSVSMGALPEEYRHEPRSALAAGKDGLDVIRIVVRSAKRHMSARGLLVIEVGLNRAVLENAFPMLPFIWPQISTGDDYVALLWREDLP
ncbi:MAG: 50S ribosomal protein L3 N(5)-glutamine methyltransferase [Burkholderiales bacterium]